MPVPDFPFGRNDRTLKVVGISAMVVSDSPADVLVTYSLGSCVGLSVFDPVAGVGGMVHCMLPTARRDPEKAKACPCMFTDTGVMKLLHAVFSIGAARGRITAKVAGAASLLDPNGIFDIGRQNHVVLRKILWKNDILVAGEAVGGIAIRTLTLDVKTGVTTVKTAGRVVEF